MELILLSCLINPFVPSSSFLYPLKTSENLTVFWCFQGVEKGCIGMNGLSWLKNTVFWVLSIHWVKCNLQGNAICCQSFWVCAHHHINYLKDEFDLLRDHNHAMY